MCLRSFSQDRSIYSLLRTFSVGLWKLLHPNQHAPHSECTHVAPADPRHVLPCRRCCSSRTKPDKACGWPPPRARRCCCPLDGRMRWSPQRTQSPSAATSCTGWTSGASGRPPPDGPSGRRRAARTKHMRVGQFSTVTVALRLISDHISLLASVAPFCF